MSLNVMTFHVRGITPICFHRGGLANPLDKFSKAIKAITRKAKKTDDELLEIARLEWFGSLYVNDDDRIVVPGRGIESAIKQTAKRSKLGKVVQASVMSDGDWELNFPKKNTSVEKLWDDENYRLQILHRVGPSRVVRTTPIFREWSLSFDLSFMPSEIDSGVLEKIVRDCGQLNGMFELRPRYGRFEVVKVE